MRKAYKVLSLTLALILALGAMGALAAKPEGVAITRRNFPDAKFRAYIRQEIDDDRNGYLSDAEINAVDEMYIDQMGIEDLRGIGFFTNLQWFCCAENKLRALDLSRNTRLVSVECQLNKLTSLTLGRQPKLAYLWCYGNRLSRVDLGGCPAALRARVTDELIGANKDYAWYGFAVEPTVITDIRTRLARGDAILRKYAAPTAVAFTKARLSLRKGWKGTLEEKGAFVALTPAYAVFPFSLKSQDASILRYEGKGMTANFLRALKRGETALTVSCNGIKAAIDVTVQ